MSARVTERVIARAKAVQILKKIPALDGLLEDEYFKVLAMCSSTEYAEGETLFEQGDEGSSLYILLSGEMEINIKGKGRVHIMKPGEIIGEMALVAKITRSATAVARKDCVMLQLYSEILHEVVKKYPRIGYIIMRNVARILAERVIEQNNR